MIRLFSITVICTIVSVCASFKDVVVKKAKWKSLFDGKTTRGWHMYGKNYVGSCWQVDNGVLHLLPIRDAQQRGDLVTDAEFENFQLKLDWKVAPKSNSGILFFVHEDTVKYKQTYFTGLEMQVLDNKDAEDNKKENHLAGSLYDLIGTAANSKAKPAGEWNSCEISCYNGKLKMYLNGHKIVSTTLWDEKWKTMVANSKFKNMAGFGAFKSGKIALQYHGGEVWFRNIRIKS